MTITFKEKTIQIKERKKLSDRLIKEISKLPVKDLTKDEKSLEKWFDEKS